MFLKSELEGYLEINAGAGITPEEATKGPPGTMAMRPGARLQFKTYKCNHCPNQVIVNPDRTRERANCYACDHWICDDCAVKLKLTGICRSWRKQVDDFMDKIICSAA